MKSHISQQGTAIVVALFVTALVAMAAVAMLERLRTDTRRTELLLNHIQANLFAEGSLLWATEQLSDDFKNKKPDEVVDRTPIKSPINRVDQATISSVIFDGQGKLNLNNLSDPPFQQVFLHLLRLTTPTLSAEKARLLMNGIVDWITVSSNSSAYDRYYEKLNPAYHAAHRPMVSVSELRLVQGVTPEIYTALLPYVTALPEKTPINLNSAPMAVLMSLSPAITAEMASAIVAFRKKNPFVSLDKLGNFTVVKTGLIGENNLTTTSSYFIVRTTVTIDQQQLTLYSLLSRQLKNSQPTIMALWQSQGTL